MARALDILRDRVIVVDDPPRRRSHPELRADRPNKIDVATFELFRAEIVRARAAELPRLHCRRMPDHHVDLQLYIAFDQGLIRPEPQHIRRVDDYRMGDPIVADFRFATLPRAEHGDDPIMIIRKALHRPHEVRRQFIGP